MEFGVGFLIDNNEEYDTRRFYSNNIKTNNSNTESSLRSYVKFEDSSKVKIYLHTLGNLENSIKFIILLLEPIVLYGQECKVPEQHFSL